MPCDVFLGAHASFYFMKEKAGRLASGEKPNPFVDPEHYRKFVRRKEQIFLDRLRQDLAQSKEKSSESAKKE